MSTLVITDIPRISALFERIAVERDDLVVVSEIHRGIEALEQHGPDLIIIQNHLSGLSADILHKHLKSRLNRRKARFALISPSESLDVELSGRFETILDPALSDEQLESTIEQLLNQPAMPARSATSQVSSILELPPTADLEVTPESATDTVQFSPTPAAPADNLAPATLTTAAEPLTYDRPRRPNLSIISAFSQHLESTVEEVQPRSAARAELDDTAPIDQLPPEPFVLTDDQRPSVPSLVRRTSFWLVVGTVVLVVIITLVQQRPRSAQQVSLPDAPSAQAPLNSGILPAPSAAGEQGRLPSHGLVRPKSLPSFIPADSIDPAYGKDNPGWESYHGQANEFRLFREQDGAIKALQVIDRSGAGMQDAFYNSILKELAGVSTMRPSSSEIKEGYDIRRGTAGGLELVQYHDAQGGRLRGIVITWP